MTALLMLAVFTLALGGAERRVGAIAFIDFLGPGMVMMTMLQNAFANTSTSLVMAKLQGNIVDLLMVPLEPFEIAAAFILGGVTRGLITGLMVSLALSPFVAMAPADWGAALFFAVMGSTMMAALGLMTGLWAVRFEHISAVTNFVIAPLTFLSGTFYSIQRLPETLQSVSQANPFFYLIDGFRYGVTGVADGVPEIGLVVTLGLDVLLCLACYRLLASGYKLKA